MAKDAVIKDKDDLLKLLDNPTVARGKTAVMNAYSADNSLSPVAAAPKTSVRTYVPNVNTTILPPGSPSVDRTSPYLSKRIVDMGMDSSEDPLNAATRTLEAAAAAVPRYVGSLAENIRVGNEYAATHAPNGTSLSDYALEQYRAGNLSGRDQEIVEDYLARQDKLKSSVGALANFSDAMQGYGASALNEATSGLNTDKVSGKVANWGLQAVSSATENALDLAAAQLMGIGTITKGVEGASKVANTMRKGWNYIPFAARSFGMGASEARSADADLSTQLDYALASTAKEIGTEMMWGVGDVFRVGAFDELAENGIKNLIRKSTMSGPMREVADKAAKLGLAFTTEGLEEVVGDLIEGYYLRKKLDPNAAPPTGADLFNSFMVGGFAGSMMGGGNVLFDSLSGRTNDIQPSAPEIIEAARNSGNEEAAALAKKVEASAGNGYLTSDLQDLAQMTAEAQYEAESKAARAQMEERVRDIQNPYRGMDTEDAAELIRRGNVYGVQGADVANAEDVSAAKLQQIAREVTKAEEATGRSETVRQAVQEAKSGTVSDETAERILNDARASEYFGADVTPNMTEAERSNVVKAAIETVAEAENRAAAERNTSNKATTQSEENVDSTGRFFDTVKETLGESGQAAFTNLMQAPMPAMSPQLMMDRARAAAIIYNAGTNGTAIESIRIQNNPLTATEMSAMYSAGVNDGRQSGIRTGERQNDLAASERSREISQRARETRARRQGATVQRTAVRAAVENEAAVSPKEIGFRNGSDTKNLKVLPESAYSALNKHDRSAVEQLKKKGFKVVLMVSADGNGIGGLLEDVQGKHYRGAIQNGNTIFLSADHWNYTVEQIARHEYFHSVLESNEGLRSAIVSRLYDQFSAAEILNMQQAYAEDYNWSGVDADYVLDEILCDAFGGMDVFEDKHLFPYHVTDYAEIVREVAKEADGGKAGFELAQRYSQDLSDVTPATRAESLKLDITDKRNVARYVDEITDVLSGTMSAEQLVLIGKPSSVLAEYMKSNKPLYMPQSAVRKAALAKAEGGKHGLGRVVVDELIYQLDDPMAITGNTSRHKAYNDNSIVVWTDWKTTAGDSIIVPIRIDVNGRVGIYNNVNTLFDVYDQGYINDLLRSENILYTRQEKSIVELLEQRRDMPELKSDNASTDTIAQSPEDGNIESPNQKFSEEKDPKTLQFLNNQKGVKVYRAMQLIDGELYPPMATRVRDESGKKRMQTSSKFGTWERAEEHPELIKGGKFELDKANGSSIAAAYNPYFHTSASPLNDQFSSAYKRPNLVVVEGIIPESELTSGYKAQYAKDSVGETKWHAGPVSSKLKGDKARRVFLSRWFKPLRVVPDAEVASVVAKTLEGENIAIPANVITPSLRTELEKAGVRVEEGKGFRGSEEQMSFIDMSEDQIKLKLEKDLGMGKKDAAYNAKTVSGIGDIYIEGSTFDGKPAGRTLAVAFREELIQDGHASLIGKRVRNAKDLATLAQVYRNPRFETMRYFFTNDAGEVVYHTGISCGLVSASALAPSNASMLRMIKEAKAAGATKAYALHNHPSGDPTPSGADIQAQKRLDNFFARHNIIPLGGVIINSNKYATYGGGHRTNTLSLGDGVDQLLSPVGQKKLVGMTVNTLDELANLAKAMQISSDYSAVIYLGAKLNVNAIQEVHNSIASDEIAMTEWVENNRPKYGAVATAFVTNNADCYDTLTDLMRDGLAVDVVRADIGTQAARNGVTQGSWLGSTMAVQEVHFSEESLKQPVSETRDLLAVHNLTYDNIRASIKLGGLPSPSIAVVKAETGHTKYGPVSFVFSKDTIDPKKNRKNRIYGADAWTPTAADARTEYPLNMKEFNKVERRLAELSQQIADGAFYNTSILSGLYSYGYSEDSLDRMAERVAHREEAKAAYAAATGKTVDVVYKDQVYSKQFGNASLQKFTDKVGAQRLAEIESNLIEGMLVEEAAGDDIETIRNIMREYYADRDAAFYNKIARVKGLSESEKQATIKSGVDKSMEKNVHDWTIEDFIHMAWAMYEDGGAPSKVVDRYATQDNLVKVAPEEDVKAWLLEELNGVLGEPGIYNGADPYNRDGSRKTFKQTHWAYTLANIVKAMNNASSRGQRAMATASGLQSVAAEEFGSIEAMREKRGRLGKVEDEAYEARTKAVEDQISAVMDDIAGKDYYFRDIAEEVLMQAATGPKSVEGIMRTFAREDIDISRDVAQEIRELFLAAAELPTEYFEAKPQRAVGLDEVLAAVVPTDAPADVVDGLRSEGVNVLTYEAGNDADRVAKMNSVDNARFSEEKASDGSTLSPAQIAFFKNSTARDENGRLQVLYHGTKKGGFTVFKGWSYLTADRSYAERYSRGGESEALYKVFANITKPFDTRLPEVRNIWQNEFFGNYSRTPLQDSGLPDWTDGYDLAEWIEEEGLDYDAILLDEGTDRGISYVIRNSNQIKNVDNLNPTENPDIRYSEEPENASRRAQQSQDELERLQQDLALSQAEVAYWKQARTTGTHVVNKADVKRVTNDVLKKWDATVKPGEITGRMEELADCLHQGMSIDEVLPLALDIADDICSSARVIADGEAYETYKDIRKYFRENKIKRVDGIGDPGFYKRNFGKIRFAKEGRAVDAMWDDWQSRWGVEFFPDDVVTSQDKVLHLVEVLDSIESLYENPYSRDYAEAVEACAYSLMDDIMSGGVRYEPVMLTSANGRAASEYNRTIAEKNRQIEQLQKEKEDAAAYYREREEQLKAEYKQKGKETAEFYRERAELMRERLERENAETIQHYMEREARAKELLKQVRERRDERIADLKQHYKEVAMGKKWRRAESDARHRLQRIAKRLQNRKLPAVSRGLLNQYIGDLDTAALSITGKKLDELKDLQAWYTNRKATDPDFIANPDIEKKLARINQKRISELSIDEVVQLTQVLMNIENTINTERQMIDSEDRRDIYAQGLETIDDIMDAKGTKANLRDWIVSNTLSPVRAVRRFTGYAENSPLYKAVESLADGQRKMFDYQMRAARLFDAWVKDKKYTKTLQDEITITGFKNGVPTDVMITRDMAIALYMHSKNDQNLAHISDGGVTIPDLKALKKDPANAYGQGAVRIKMSPAMVRQIASKLTAQDKAYAAAAAKYFDTMAQMEINEVSEKLVGYSLAQVENYFPINTDANFTRKEFESLQMDGTIEGMGFLKERTDAKNPIYLRGFSEVLNKSIDMNSKYVGLAIPVRNFNKLWNVTTADYSDADNIQHFTGSVKEAMNQKWGKRGVNYIEKMMTDLQNANVKSDELDSLLGKVRSNYAGAVLTLNLSVAIKQAASYPTAGAVLGGKALAKALANPKVDPNLIAKYTPLYWYRSQGFADQELGDLKRRNRQIPKLLNWIQAADMATTRTLWKASEYYVRDNNKDLQIGTDAYYQEVARIYNRVIEETQPNYTTMQRPQLLRSDSSMVQSIAMFKTQPFQNFNVLYDAVGEYEALARAKKAGADVDLKQAGKNVRRAVSSQVVQLAVFSAMTFIWNMIRRKHDKYADEEGEMTAASTFKGIGKDMISGSFSMVPFGSNMYELMDSIINGAQYYGFDSVTITALDDTATAIINQWNLVKDATGTVIEGGTPDWNTFRIKTKKNLNSISKLAGIPVENVNNLYEAAYHWAAIYSEGEYMGEYRYLCLTISPNSSKVKYYALLKKAWLNDQKAFNQLQQEMLDSGYFTEKGINQKIGSWKKEVGQ